MIERVLAGDREAYATLVHRYGRRVHDLARRILRDAHEAEDAAQQAFLNAYRALPRFDFRRPFRHWLLRITTNLCRNRLVARRHRALSLTAEEDAGGGAWLDPVDPDAPPGEAPGLADAALDADRVRAAIERLPDAYRVAVVLYYINDLSLEEVSEITEVPVATVKTHLHRARAALKRMLSADGAPGETSAAGGGTT